MNARVFIAGAGVGTLIYAALSALDPAVRASVAPVLFGLVPLLMVGADFQARKFLGYIPNFHESDLLPWRVADMFDARFHALARKIETFWWVNLAARLAAMVIAIYWFSAEVRPLAGVILTVLGSMLIGTALALILSAAYSAHQVWEWRRQYDQRSADERRRRERLRTLGAGGSTPESDTRLQSAGANHHLHCCAH